MSAMPAHVQRALIDAGELTPDRVTSTARRRTCPTCKAWCLVAIPAWMHGAAWVDLHATTNHGELDALMAGRRTFDLNGDRSLTWRDSYEIGTRPAETRPVVHPEHHCGTVNPVHPRDNNSPPARITDNNNIPAPF